eukprot:scaffold56443_cov65-Phaeocystis_antarctica.AAC.2
MVNTRSRTGAKWQRLTPSGVAIKSVKDAGRRRRRSGRGVATISQQERGHSRKGWKARDTGRA